MTALPFSPSLQFREVKLLGVFQKVSRSGAYSAEVPFSFASSAQVLRSCGRR